MSTLQRDVAFMDLVSHLKGAPDHFPAHARALVEKTGLGTASDADRALALLSETPVTGCQWDRPMTEGERQQRFAENLKHLCDADQILSKLWFGIDENSGKELGENMQVVASLFCLLVGGALLYTQLAPVSVFVGSLIIIWGAQFFGCRWGIRQAKRNAVQYADKIVSKRNARHHYHQVQCVAMSKSAYQRWSAFPEVTQQADKWFRSDPGLMVGDVMVLDRRCLELKNSSLFNKVST